MGIIYWQDDSQSFQIARSMQAVALDLGLWQAYYHFGTKGRAVFRQCAQDDYDWSFDTVLAYATYEETPQQTVTTPSQQPTSVTPSPQPTSSTATQVFVRQRGNDEDTKEGKFIAWMLEITAAVKQDSSLVYVCGGRRVLNDGTVAVSVSVRRGSAFLHRVSFVFHYHPGAKGSTVGSTEGSKWHFKPFDGAKKWVRLADYAFGKLDGAMVKRVKEIARGK